MNCLARNALTGAIATIVSLCVISIAPLAAPARVHSAPELVTNAPDHPVGRI